MLSTPPPWVKRGAIVHLDFKNGRYWGPGFGTVEMGSGNSARERMASICNGFQAAGGGAANVYYAPDKDGIYRPGDANGNRITSGMGLWVENSAVNFLLQSRDLTQAVWTATGVTASHTNIPSCDGKTSGASRITATAPGGTILQVTMPFGMSGGDGITINNGGTSGTYAAGNTLTLVGGTGTTAMTLAVKTASAGQVATLQSFPGNVGLYTIRPTFPATVTGGGGLGATFTVNDTYIFSFPVKRNAGTGTVSMTLDGTTYTDITSQINSSTYSLVQITAANPSGMSPGFKFAVSGDAVDVDMGQVEFALQGIHTATTRIVTTTVPVPRGNISGASASGEEAFFNNPSVTDGFNAGWKLIKDIFSHHEHSCLIIGSGNAAPGCLMTGTDLNYFFSGGFDGNPATLNGGSTGSSSFSSTNNGNSGLGSRNKALCALGGGGASIFLNGVLTKSTACHITSDNSTHGGIGNRGAGDIPINGVCEEFVVWPFVVTDGAGLFYTTPDA